MRSILAVVVAGVLAGSAAAQYTVLDGDPNQYIPFYATDTDGAPLTGLTGFTIYSTRNATSDVTYTTPTVVEDDEVNKPGLYWLLVDENHDIAAGYDFQSLAFIIHNPFMPEDVPVAVQIVRPKSTPGTTLDVNATGGGSIDWAAIDNPTATVALTGSSLNLTATAVDNIWDELVSGHETESTFAMNLRDALSNASAAAGSSNAAKIRVELALPPIAPAAAGGVPTVDASNFVAGVLGLDPNNLDMAVSEVETGLSQPRSNKRALPPYRLKLSTMSDGTYKAIRADGGGPIRLRPGTVDDIAVELDMRPIAGDAYVETVGTPAVSAGSITAAALGPRDTSAMIELGGTATASEQRTISVDVGMETDETIPVTFDVRVFAD